MPITIFDGVVLGVVLFSAVLAMVRGFSREVLSIASWIGSVAAAWYLHPLVQPFMAKYTSDAKIALAGSIGIVFIVALIVISFITSRIADFIIDSSIGALDRTLGFLYGAARGILVVAVGLLFFNWLVGANPPAWISEAKSRPLLENIGARIQALLPDDPENSILKRLSPGGDEAGTEGGAEQGEGEANGN